VPGFNIPFAQDCDDNPSAKPKRVGDVGILPTIDIETARSHRFRFSVTFAFLANTTSSISIQSDAIVDLYPKKISRPSIDIDEITIHSGQDEIFRPGKQHHQPVEIEFYETVGPRGSVNSPALTNPVNLTARTLFNWWRNRTLQYETSQIGSPDFLNNTVNIIELDGIGQQIWNYYLYRCWPQRVTPCDHDYTDSAIQTTSVRLRYDKMDEVRTRDS
jgi:hypothetical protein